ncbi:hypothetical protein V6N11_072677 [Hibiscus sabdariffa]|uniref:Uncharacterized protein n=1 Tax=Hibiscus sabdariffa TaxID=183260 RepID=A0ABR2U3S1_9ROSI
MERMKTGEDDWIYSCSRYAIPGAFFNMAKGELPFSFSLPILSSRSMDNITQDFHTTDVCGSKYPWFLMQTGSTEGGKLQSIRQENSLEIYLTLLILNQKE